MTTLNKLLNEITALTCNIETNYPELYQYLDEIPLTINSKTNGTIGQDVFEEYLDSLKHLLKDHLRMHKKPRV